VWRSLVLLACGCNQVLGLDQTGVDMRTDLDGDGIADIEDPCIVTDADLIRDSEGDGVANADDPCPFSRGTADGDRDGITDDCDPFATAGDRHVCSMVFGSRALNATLWSPRAGEQEFAIATGYLIGFEGSSFVANQPIVPKSPTVVLDLAAGTFGPYDPFSVGMWLSAFPTHEPRDVACRVVSDGTLFHVEIVGPTGMVSSPLVNVSDTGYYYLRAYLQPSLDGVNVACGVGYPGDGLAYVRGHIDAPLANFGFVADAGATYVEGLFVYDRADLPSLP